jgi:hypothetical protein
MAIQWSETTVTVENVLDDDPNVHLYNAREYLKRNDYVNAVRSVEYARRVSNTYEQRVEIEYQCFPIVYIAQCKGYAKDVFLENTAFHLYSVEKSIEDGYYSNAVEHIKYAWAGNLRTDEQEKCMGMLKKLQSLGYGTNITWEQEAIRDKKKCILEEIIICFIMLILFNWLFDGIIVWVLELCVVLPVFIEAKKEPLVTFLKQNEYIVAIVEYLGKLTLIGLAVYFVFSYLLGWNVVTNIVWLFGGAWYVYDICGFDI